MLCSILIKVLLDLVSKKHPSQQSAYLRLNLHRHVLARTAGEREIKIFSFLFSSDAISSFETFADIVITLSETVFFIW